MVRAKIIQPMNGNHKHCGLLCIIFFTTHLYFKGISSSLSSDWDEYNSTLYKHCLCNGEITFTDLCVYPLLHVHGSTCHVIDLVLDVGHGFVCAPNDTHNGNLWHKTWRVIQQWDRAIKTVTFLIKGCQMCCSVSCLEFLHVAWDNEYLLFSSGKNTNQNTNQIIIKTGCGFWGGIFFL